MLPAVLISIRSQREQKHFITLSERVLRKKWGELAPSSSGGH